MLMPALDQRYDGERFELDRCPVRYITADMMDLFRRLRLCDCKVSFGEQDDLPQPYIEAIDEVIAQRQKKLESDMKK